MKPYIKAGPPWRSMLTTRLSMMMIERLKDLERQGEDGLQCLRLTQSIIYLPQLSKTCWLGILYERVSAKYGEIDWRIYADLVATSYCEWYHLSYPEHVWMSDILI